MTKSFIITVLGMLVGLFAVPAQAELTPGACYFQGNVKVGLIKSERCFVEVLYSNDGSQIQTRAITSLQHTGAGGEILWISVGPYTANYLAPRALYRYQDPTPGAVVKDLVVNTTAQTTPTKFAILYWHAQAGHHDPVICDGLSEKTSEQDLKVMDETFAHFDELKP